MCYCWKPSDFHLAYSVWVFFKYLFVYLAALGLSCGMWDLVPEQGWNPGPLHREHSLNHGTAREVPGVFLRIELDTHF